MGFNFGAFAAGALEGAGDLMAKQHKDTKDTIDKNMTFAYQQGLPYHRARKERQRKLEGYASDLSSMQLSSDQIDAVMGKSESFIVDFISNSQAELKRKGGKFDVGSQINMPTDGRRTPWHDVQMGTADKSTIPQQQPTSRKSLFSTMSGGTEGSSAGFRNMKDRAQSQFEGITGASYDDVTAAGGGYYNYEQGSEATITMADSSAQNQYESQSLALEDQIFTSPLRMRMAALGVTQAETTLERSIASLKVEKITNKLAILVGEYKLKTNAPIEEIDYQLKAIERKTATLDWGNSPEQGLYIAKQGLHLEMNSDNPDPEKIAAYESSIELQNLMIGENYARSDKYSNKLSFANWNSSLKSKIDKYQRRGLPDPKKPYWTYSTVTGDKEYDFSGKGVKQAMEIADRLAKNEMLGEVRNLIEDGGTPSSTLIYFMGQQGFRRDMIMLPSLPTDLSTVSPDQSYVRKNAKGVYGTILGSNIIKAREGGATVTDSTELTSNTTTTPIAPQPVSEDVLADQYAAFANRPVVKDAPNLTSNTRVKKAPSGDTLEDYFERRAVNNEFNATDESKQEINDLYRNLLRGFPRMDKAERLAAYRQLAVKGITPNQLIYAQRGLSRSED